LFGLILHSSPGALTSSYLQAKLKYPLFVDYNPWLFVLFFHHLLTVVLGYLFLQYFLWVSQHHSFLSFASL
jgi:hypothetical protein